MHHENRDRDSCLFEKAATWSFSALSGREIDRLRRVIRLRLNPLGRYDKQITALLEEIPTYTDPLLFAKLSPALDELTKTTRLLLLAADEIERGVQ